MVDDGGNTTGNEPMRREWHVPGTREELAGVIDGVLDALRQAGHGDAAVFAVRLALEEALVNAVRHGHGGDESRRIRVVADVGGRSVHIEVVDEGAGFDPASVPDPTAEENLTIASGRGLALMRAFMSEVIVYAPGNRIALRFVLDD